LHRNLSLDECAILVKNLITSYTAIDYPGVDGFDSFVAQTELLQLAAYELQTRATQLFSLVIRQETNSKTFSTRMSAVDTSL
jgi:hypothetical protein